MPKRKQTPFEFKYSKRAITAIALLLFVQIGKANSLEKLEDEIALQAMIVQQGRADSVRLAAHEQMQLLLDSALRQPESFKYDFTKLSSISFLKSSDQQVRLITWAVPLLDGRYTYGGFIQVPTDSTPHITALQIPEDPIEFIAERKLNAQNWYGCLYYEIRLFEHKKEKYYAIAGWDGNNSSSNKKYLDVLRFEKGKGWIFGDKIFETAQKKQTRFIMEYKEDAGVTLSYNKREKMFVFDHLIPVDGAPMGMYSYYVPDFTYDGYRFKKGKFILVENLDVTNDQRYDLPGGAEPTRR